MSAPIRPIDPLTAALAAADAALGARTPPEPPAEIDPAAWLLGVTLPSLSADSTTGLDTLILGSPPPAANPAHPELVAARLRVRLRDEEWRGEEETDAQPGDQEHEQSPPEPRAPVAEDADPETREQTTTPS